MQNQAAGRFGLCGDDSEGLKTVKTEAQCKTFMEDYKTSGFTNVEWHQR